MKKVLRRERLFGLLALMMALMLTPVVSMAAVGISNWQDISPAVSERYPDAPLPAPADNAQALSSPTLAQSTVVGFGGRQWVVIGWDGEGVASEPNTATLLLADASPDKPANSNFHASSNHYEGSVLRTAMANVYNAMTTREQSAIVPRSLDGGSGNFTNTGVAAIDPSTFSTAAGTASTRYIGGWRIQSNQTFDWYAYHGLRIAQTVGTGAYTGSYHPDHIAGNAADAHLWPLSVAEASLLDESIRRYNNFWWLRSPGHDSIFAASANSDGHVDVYGIIVNLTAAVRPAFRPNLASVIFTSTAGADGKSAANIGTTLHQATSPVGAAATPAAVKFTILDASLSLGSVTPTSKTGDTVSFNYTGATAGMTLSAVVRDNSGAVTHYGRLVASTDASGNGSASVVLPAGFAATDTLYIFVEEINGDNETDFASALVALNTGELEGAVSISGTVAVGQTLSANTTGITSAAPLGALSYQWLRGGIAIAGETGNTYTLTAADVGQTITVTVSAANYLGELTSGGVTVLSNNAALLSVAGQAITASGGTGTVGDPITASISVAHGVSSLDVGNLGAATGATAELMDDATFANALGAAQALNVGANTVYVRVTAADGVTTLHYVLSVTRAMAAVYNVVYHLNGGTQEAGAWNSYTFGVGLTLPTVPTLVDHSFTGWYDNAGLGGAAVTAISNTDTGDKEFWAKWLSSDARLLSVAGQTVTASGGTGTVADPYIAAINVAHGLSSLDDAQLTAAATGAAAKLMDDATFANALGAAQALNVGANTVYVRVTAADGVTTLYYVLTVHRAMAMGGSTTASIPVMGPVGLGLLVLMLAGLAARVRRRKGF